MTKWKVTQVVKTLPKMKEPVLIEGLPGIGNVGKVACDFIMEEISAVKIYDLFSYSLPHSVFVGEDNLVELPNIGIFHKKVGNRDILFLAGDVQPIDEISSYEFTDTVLDVFQELGGKEIVTLGGIGLPQVPKKPKVYSTGNNKEIIKRWVAGTSVESTLYGTVGPIIGISGLLLGMSKRRNVPAVSLLAETYARPMYLGIRGAREIVRVLTKKLTLKIDLTELDKEVAAVEAELNKRQDPMMAATLRKLQSKLGKDMSYIG
jgi:uncharacterized protein